MRRTAELNVYKWSLKVKPEEAYSALNKFELNGYIGLEFIIINWKDTDCFEQRRRHRSNLYRNTLLSCFYLNQSRVDLGFLSIDLKT